MAQQPRMASAWAPSAADIDIWQEQIKSNERYGRLRDNDLIFYDKNRLRFDEKSDPSSGPWIRTTVYFKQRLATIPYRFRIPSIWIAIRRPCDTTVDPDNAPEVPHDHVQPRQGAVGPEYEDVSSNIAGTSTYDMNCSPREESHSSGDSTSSRKGETSSDDASSPSDGTSATSHSGTAVPIFVVEEILPASWLFQTSKTMVRKFAGEHGFLFQPHTDRSRIQMQHFLRWIQSGRVTEPPEINPIKRHIDYIADTTIEAVRFGINTMDSHEYQVCAMYEFLSLWPWLQQTDRFVNPIWEATEHYQEPESHDPFDDANIYDIDVIHPMRWLIVAMIAAKTAWARNRGTAVDNTPDEEIHDLPYQFSTMLTRYTMVNTDAAGQCLMPRGVEMFLARRWTPLDLLKRVGMREHLAHE